MSSDLSSFLASTDPYHVHHGDVIPFMLETLPPACVDLAITSIPFPSLFSYTSEEADIGNSEERAEQKLHFSYFFRGLARILKPGRVAAIHCMQIPRMKRTGGRGLIDFRGTLIRIAQRAGLYYEYDWLISKNPQAQAIRTKSHSLQFAGLEKDRAACRGALCDYVIKLSAPGDNAVPVQGEGEVHRNDWIEWAEGSWDNIRETDTLNLKGTKGEGDTKHICPLQLSLIERLIRLFSNPGELVFDPFSGLGSTGFVALGGSSPATGRALLHPRRYLGAELKPEYHATSLRNLASAVRQSTESQKTLFDMANLS